MKATEPKIDRWTIGDRIAHRWQIERVCTGGMGIVYVVYDHDWHQPLAVKTFRDEVFASGRNAIDQFTAEGTAWTRLDAHENIVQARFVRVM